MTFPTRAKAHSTEFSTSVVRGMLNRNGLSIVRLTVAV